MVLPNEDTKNGEDAIDQMREWGLENIGPVADFIVNNQNHMMCAAGLAPFSGLWEVQRGLSVDLESSTNNFNL